MAKEKNPNGREDEVVDLEEYARSNRPHSPGCKRYRIRIDRERFLVHETSLTGRELLQLAGKCPPEGFQVFQKVRGGTLELVDLEEEADFTRPGVERFVTLPLDQTEG